MVKHAGYVTDVSYIILFPRMRGAALKIGQMLSIQDDNLLPPQVGKGRIGGRIGWAQLPPLWSFSVSCIWSYSFSCMP